MPRIVKIVVVLTLVATLAGCGTNLPSGHPDGFGFFQGLWDGFTLLFAWIASWFSADVALHSPDSNGWYDTGFIFGISLWFGLFAAN